MPAVRDVMRQRHATRIFPCASHALAIVPQSRHHAMLRPAQPGRDPRRPQAFRRVNAGGLVERLDRRDQPAPVFLQVRRCRLHRLGRWQSAWVALRRASSTTCSTSAAKAVGSSSASRAGRAPRSISAFTEYLDATAPQPAAQGASHHVSPPRWNTVENRHRGIGDSPRSATSRAQVSGIDTRRSGPIRPFFNR
jgi:hypothetical protein